MVDKIAKTACELLKKKEPFVIASIISHQGSMPRTAGTQMIVTADGRGIGTIGGGLLEARSMQRAGEVLHRNTPTLIPFDLSCDDVTAMDMICGGVGMVLLDIIVPCPENVEVFDKWNRMSAGGEKGFFLTVVSGGEQKIDKISRCVVDARNRSWGSAPLAPEQWEEICIRAREADGMTALNVGGAVVVIEPAVRPKTAFFFGAGHVAQPTVHLAAMTGFRTVVLDDRAEFSNRTRFPEADEIHVLEDFDKAFHAVSMDVDAFIVIFTRGHLHDRTVLSQALKTDAGYIGMIGSRRKRDAIYKALTAIGFVQREIDRVRSPIGLDIGAQTPEEIAVSIVAEMIRERSKMK